VNTFTKGTLSSQKHDNYSANSMVWSAHNAQSEFHTIHSKKGAQTMADAYQNAPETYNHVTNEMVKHEVKLM
jgi:hypothetical protein